MRGVEAFLLAPLIAVERCRKRDLRDLLATRQAEHPGDFGIGVTLERT